MIHENHDIHRFLGQFLSSRAMIIDIILIFKREKERGGGIFHAFIFVGSTRNLYNSMKIEVFYHDRYSTSLRFER